MSRESNFKQAFAIDKICICFALNLLEIGERGNHFNGVNPVSTGRDFPLSRTRQLTSQALKGSPRLTDSVVTQKIPFWDLPFKEDK